MNLEFQQANYNYKIVFIQCLYKDIQFKFKFRDSFLNSIKNKLILLHGNSE